MKDPRLSTSAFRLFLVFAFTIVACAKLSAQVWTVLSPDAKGDGQDSSLPDAAQLCYRYDNQQDYLWFRIAVYGTPNADKFGVNLVFDTGDEKGEKTNWWGANKAFSFDKLLTAWVTQIGRAHV